MDAPDRPVVIAAESLTAGYGGPPVLRGVSFTLRAGGFTAVLGKNGSGKSTLLKALQALVRPSAGRSLLQGDDAAVLSPREVARRVAYVPQVSPPAFEFTAFEIVEMGRYARLGRLGRLGAEDARAIDEALERTGTARFRDVPLSRLSGGERQRVLIARALAQDAPVLLLDEPSSHLDIAHQTAIYGLLDTLRRERGTAVLAAEHNVNLAALYAERLILLRDGEVAAQGAPADLIERETIRRVFDADVAVRPNPASGAPEISLLPGDGGRA